MMTTPEHGVGQHTTDAGITPTAGPNQTQTPHGVRPGKVFQMLLPLFLIAIMGLSVAPVAAIHSGWAKYHHSNIAYQTPGVLPGPITLKIRVGWLKAHNTFQDLFHQMNPSQVPKYTDNKDVKKVGEIVPAICIAWLLLSALVAFLYFLVWSFSLCTARRAARSSKAGAKPRVPFVSSLLWSLLAPILGLGSIGLSIATYIVLAVGVSIYTRQNLGGRVYIAWPDWAWFLAMASGLFWLLLTPLVFGASVAARAARRSTRTGPVGDLDERKAPAFNAPGPMDTAAGNGHHAGAWNDKNPTYANDENVNAHGNGYTNGHTNGHTNGYTNGHTANDVV